MKKITPVLPTEPNEFIVQIETVPYRHDADPETPSSRAYAVTLRTTTAYIQDQFAHSTLQTANARLEALAQIIPSAKIIRQPA